MSSRGWRRDNPDAVKASNTKHRLDNRAKLLLQGAERRARAKGVPFNLLDFESHYADVIDAGVCQVTGLPFDFKLTGRRSPFAPSLDRIRPKLGYVHGNVRVVLWGLNTALADWGEDAYATIAEAFLRQSRR